MFLLLLMLLVPGAVLAQDSVPTNAPSHQPTVAFSAFADTYYAWDVGKPDAFDRPFTTQPARHNEFNVNLAYVDARLSAEKFRGRVALQAGTSVQANYAAEPTTGNISGDDLSRFIQEATVGVRIVPGLWVDGGIYFSYIGQESFISRDNPTYTRSLLADYTPYYLSGAKLTWEASRTVTAQFHVMNGWQNISENNGDKALGARVDWMATPRLLLAASTFIGNEQPDSLPSKTRFYSQAMTRWTPSEQWAFWGTVDYGIQEAPDDGTDIWWGFAAIAQRALSDDVRIAARFERLADPEQVVVVTGLPYGFETWAVSIGVDVDIERRVLWRTEVRGFFSSEPLWPEDGIAAQANDGGFIVTSLALTL